MAKYTVEQVDVMVGEYTAVKDEDYDTRTAVVKALAEKFGTTEGSVRSKLVSEDVYVGKEKAEGETAKVTTSKAELVSAFGAVVGMPLPSMEKMTKRDLQALWDWIVLSSDQRAADTGEDPTDV